MYLVVVTGSSLCTVVFGEAGKDLYVFPVSHDFHHVDILSKAKPTSCGGFPESEQSGSASVLKV